MIYAINSELLIYFNNYDFLKIASRILFIVIVNTLKNTKKSPNQPRMIAIDNKLEPKSRCIKSCMNYYINSYYLNFKIYFFD